MSTSMKRMSKSTKVSSRLGMLASVIVNAATYRGFDFLICAHIQHTPLSILLLSSSNDKPVLYLSRPSTYDSAPWTLLENKGCSDALGCAWVSLGGRD